MDLKNDYRRIRSPSGNQMFVNIFNYGPGAADFPGGPAANTYIRDIYDYFATLDPTRNVGVAAKIVPDFTCPSDTVNQGTVTYTVMASLPYCNAADAFGNAMDDMLFVISSSSMRNCKRTNYLGVGGTEPCVNSNTIRSKWGGVMTFRIPMTLENASNLDGTSRTFMYGEVLGDVGGIWSVDPTQPVATGAIVPGRRFAAHTWAYGGISRLRSYNFPPGTMVHPNIRNTDNAGQYLRLLGDGKLCDAESYGAVHPAGVNFAFADATVFTVPRTINWELYYGNGGLKDGTAERGF